MNRYVPLALALLVGCSSVEQVEPMPEVDAGADGSDVDADAAPVVSAPMCFDVAGVPLADGTPCGDGGVCMFGKCQ